MDKKITPVILKELLVDINKADDKLAGERVQKTLKAIYGLMFAIKGQLFVVSLVKEGYCSLKGSKLYLTSQGRSFIGR